MTDFLLYISTAFALVFVLEGLLYALFPDGVRRMMAMALGMPTNQLRMFGGIMVCTGFFLVWILQFL